jgi:hypothetical protein
MSVFKWDAIITLTCEVEVDYELEDGIVFIDNVTHEGVTVELTGEQWRHLYVALDEVVRDLEGVQP